jgi:co-chaperonin GroES (HSP10)
MKVLGSFVLIIPIEAKEEQSSLGGFITSVIDNSKMRYQEATVVQAGTDVTCVKEGDLIAFENSSGHTIRIDGVFYTLILARDIAIIL